MITKKLQFVNKNDCAVKGGERDNYLKMEVKCTLPRNWFNDELNVKQKFTIKRYTDTAFVP